MVPELSAPGHEDWDEGHPGVSYALLGNPDKI
jgi:hypothetical protein